MPTFRPALLVVVVVAAACDGGEPPREPTLSAIRTDIFEPRCSLAAGCHASDAPANGLDLAGDAHANLVDVASQDNPDVKRVVPADPEASLLFQVLQGDVGGVRQMPPGFTIDPAELEQIRQWIADGAADD